MRSLSRAAVPLALLAVSAQAASWHMRGPDGGPVADVAASPTSLYAATQAGVYRSLDDGRTWSRSGTGVPHGNPIERLAISPTDPDVVWAYGNGIHWRSGDGGASWMRAGPETTERLWPVTFDDAGNGDSLVTYHQSQRLLWHSADGGISWRTLTIGSGVQGWLDTLAVDARHRRYYAIADAQLSTAASGTGSWRVLGQYSYNQTQLLPDGSGQGLILVFQNVENYRIVRYDIPTRAYSEGLSLPNSAWLIGDPTTPGRLWLQTSEHHGTTSWRLRESRDFGRSWDAPHSANPVRTIAADPNRFDRLYGTGPEGLSISDDVGRHWETRTRGIPLAQVNAVALHPHDPVRLLAGTALGEIRFSDDGGAQWSEPASGLPGAPILSLAYAPSEPAIAFASTTSGLFRSDDGGRSWRAVASSGLPEAGAIDTLIVDAVNASLLTARTQGEGLYWSDDAGLNWRLGAAEIVRIAAAPSGRRIYALQHPWPNSPGRWFRLLRADRHGAAFERVEEFPLTMAVAVNPHADNVILALSNETGGDLSYATRLSSDGGVTWLERDRLFLTSQRTVRLQFDGCDSRTVYATTSGSTFARSHDLGMTWIYETLPASGGTLHELSTACHEHRSHVIVHGGPRGVLVREPETVDAIWRWGYDGD